MSEYQKNIISRLSKEKRDFIEKQLQVYNGKGFMENSMFMPCDGYCYRCKGDIITKEIEKGNDGSRSVTGCPLGGCSVSFCD